MKSEENEDDFIFFDGDDIEKLEKRHKYGREIESNESDSYVVNKIASGNIEDVFDESEHTDDNDSLTTAHLPIALLNICFDISNRDGISQESVAFALFTALSSIFAEKIQICQKRNDKSAVLAAVISPMMLTVARSAQKSSFKRMLRTLLQSHIYLNPNSQNELFDFRTLVGCTRRDFSGSKIKLLKRGETGRIEVIFSRDSFERNGNTLNPETQNFFVSIDETGLQSITKSFDNASLLKAFVLLNPSPVIWRSNGIAIDVDSVVAISQIFARISNRVNEFEGDDKLTLRFSKEAQAVYFELADNLKRHLDQSTEHPAIIAHLDEFDEIFCKISLLLHICECAAAGTQITDGCEIGLIAAERARAWCAILETHARAIFQNLLSTNSPENQILQKIAEGRLGENFTAREITRAQWTNLKSPVEVKKALIELVENGKLRVVTEQGTGRPTTRYEPVDIEEVEVVLDSKNDE